MPQYTYPGVYVEEIPSGLHTITGVGTSTAAFIDFFKEGPSNKAVQITGLGDFQRLFGGLDDRSEASYAISQFFLNGGTNAYVVRVAKDNPSGTRFRKAKVTLCADDAHTTGILEVSAANEGQWGNNLRVEIDHNTSDPANQFNLYATRYSGKDGKALPLVTETYLNLSMDKNSVRYAVDVVNGDSKLITLKRLTADAVNTIPAASGLVSGDLLAAPALTGAQIQGLNGKSFVMTIGSLPNKTVTIQYPAGEIVNTLQGLRKYLEIAIKNADTTTASASFTGASVELVTYRVGGTDKAYLRIVSGKRSATYTPSEVIACNDGPADSVATLLKILTGAGTTDNVQEYVLGADASAGAQLMVTDGVGADGEKPGPDEILGQRAVKPYTGMYALESADLFNILCVPRAAEPDITDTQLTVIYANAIKYCEEKRAFLLIDIPESVNTVEEMKDWMAAHDSLRHKNAAVFFPRLQQPDPLDEYRPRDVGNSGTVAGLFARVDNTRGVWKAAAGTEVVLRGLAGLAAEMTDAENGILNPLAINCFRIFPIYGMISWGGRTLEGSDQAGSEWKYIPVRRLALFLEESLFRGTKWVVFEPNDEPLWARVRMNLGAFMMSLFRQGAFQGTTPDKAFYVKCDSETTTQDDRNKGIVNIEVGFAPLKPAEFVVLKFQQIIQKD